MTNPPWYTPAEPELGVQSPLALRQRAEFFAELGRYSGRPLTGEVGLGSIEQSGRPSEAELQPTGSLDALPDAALVGRAEFWGIPPASARMIPREQLVAIVADMEKRYRQPMPGLLNAAMRTTQLGSNIAGLDEYFVGLGVGGAKGFTKLFKNLPGIGEYFSKTEAIQAADQWLGKVEEGLKMMTPQELQSSLSIGMGVGNVATMWYPAVGAWNIAGKAGAIVPLAGKITSPIVRQAAQGGAAAYLLEGGSEHPGAAVVLGAAGGAIIPPLAKAVGAVVSRFGPMLEIAGAKIAKAFPVAGKQIREAGTPLGPEMSPDSFRRSTSAMEVSLEPEVENQLLRVVSDPAMPEEAKATARTLLTELRKTRPETPGRAEELVGVAARSRDTGRVTSQRGFEGGHEALPGTPASWQQRQGTFEDGFITSSGRFVSRAEGLEIARTQHQLRQVGASRMRGGGTYEGMGSRSELEAGDVVNSAVREAEAMAVQMNKQSILTESSSLPQVIRQTLPDEASVAQAAIIDNPGGTNVISGISDPARFVQSIAPSGHNIRFARGPQSKTLDAILSDEPITDAMVTQYEKFGFYTGQEALTTGGIQVRIKEVVAGKAWVQPAYGGETKWVHLENLMPSAISPGSREVPGMWKELQQYATSRAEQANKAVGGTLTPARVAQMKDDNFPTYIEDFLDEAGISAISERARIKQFFNEQFVAEFKALAPEENLTQRVLAQQLAATEAAVPSSPLARLDAKAAAKGFVVVPDGGTGEYRLIDLHGVNAGGSRMPGEVVFESREAAEAWITKLQRNLPDVTPPTNVPGEVAEALPTAGIHDPATPNADDLMSLQVDDALGMADEMIATQPELGARLRADVELAAQSGDLGKIQAAWEYGWAQAQPMRARFLEVERNLAQRGASFAEIKPFQTIYDPVSTAQVRYHNEVYPWLERWANIMAKFDQQDVRTGVVTQIWELTDPVTRRAAAVAKGFTQEQIAGLDEMESYINELGGRDAARKVASYLSRLRVRQSLPLNQREQFDMGQIDDVVRPFAEFASGNSLQLRELDAKVLGNQIARSVMFQRHLAPAWEPAMQAAKQIKSVEGMEEMGDLAMGWLDIVKKGYNPQPDQFLNFMHTVMGALVPGFTKAQTRQLFGTVMSVTHRALLGWRPDVWARDSMQLILALPRVGTDLLGAMKTYASVGAAERKLMWDRALEGGWVTRGQPRIASPGAFEDPLVYVEEGVAPVAQHVESARYRALQRAADFVHDILPTQLRNPAGTPIDPLYLYTKQSERMRLLPGLAMAQRADREILAFRQMGGQGSMDDLLGKTGARTFDQSVQQKFKEFVASGNDKEAANFLARQVSDATQFKYGLSENPELARTLGGRMFMQMGNFTTQFYQYLRESVRNGNSVDKAKFLATMGGVTLAFKIAKQTTGWDFDKWQFYHSLSFTGGPWTRPLADLITGASAVSQMATQEGGRQTSTGQQQQQDAGRLGNAVGDILNMINPLAGGMRTAGGVRQALESPDPLDALGRLVFTGERGNAQDYREIFADTFGPLNPVPDAQQLTPLQSPVRGSGIGQPTPQAPTTPQGLPPAIPGTQVDSATAKSYGVPDSSRISIRNGEWVYQPVGRNSVHNISLAPVLLKPGQTWDGYEDEVIRRTEWSDTTRVNDIKALAPEMRPRVEALQAMAAEAGIKLDVLETARSQPLQEYYFGQGRTAGRPGKVVTWTLTSAHGQGKAVDFLVNRDMSGSDPGYEWLWKAAAKVGLVPLGPNDPGHLAGTDSSFAATPQYNGPSRPAGAQF